MTSRRKTQAQKSLLVQVNSEKSYQELFNYCSEFGKIKEAQHYTITDEELHFILLEFNELSDYEEAFSHCVFDAERTKIPVRSPFVWFKAKDTRKSKIIDKDKNIPKLRHEVVKGIEENALYEILSSAETLNDQILILHRTTQLNELGIRLRYLAGRQLEMALNAMFPHIQACLFGSSVNGFGGMGCDLDLILRPNDDIDISDSRLVFHTKTSLLNERSQTQRQMETIGDIMHIFLPAINNVRKILNARVPIIKYNHECLDLDIDFSMSNMSGFYMGELLYLYGEIDERVRPLVFCIRKWANSCGLTNSAAPGRWITNFSLTVMVLFFLQTLRNPILPSLTSLIKAATPSDIRVTEDNISCTFLRDLNKLKFQSTNDDSLQLLLLQFFEFYSNFDFRQSGISLIKGKEIVKPDHSALWITNPLEPLLNVSKNVSFEELERLKIEAKNAAWTLESSIDKTKDSTWGLMNLFKAKRKNVKPEMFFKSRLVEVTDLFGNDNSLNNYDRIHYKNPAIRSAVKNIQKATQREISNYMKNS